MKILSSIMFALLYCTDNYFFTYVIFYSATMLNPSSNKGAYIGMAPTKIPSINIDGTGYMLNESAKYTANTGMGSISVANSNLNGTGTLVSIITGASNGTLIKRIIIKATGNCTQGMIRFYINIPGASTYLLFEVEVPPVTQSATVDSFSSILETDFNLKSGYILRASTENAETFRITAEGCDWAY
jgi:hypothetical protein